MVEGTRYAKLEAVTYELQKNQGTMDEKLRTVES